MSPKIRTQLSVMMFLEFFVWGVWFVTMGTYLASIGFKGVDIAAAYSTTNWGAFLAPFFIGMIADRFFSGAEGAGRAASGRRRPAVLGLDHPAAGPLLLGAAGLRPAVHADPGAGERHLVPPDEGSRAPSSRASACWGPSAGSSPASWSGRSSSPGTQQHRGHGHPHADRRRRLPRCSVSTASRCPPTPPKSAGKKVTVARRAGPGRPGADEGPVLRGPGDLARC